MIIPRLITIYGSYLIEVDGIYERYSVKLSENKGDRHIDIVDLLWNRPLEDANLQSY